MSGGVTTYFVYDGDTPVAEFDSNSSPVALNAFGATGLVMRSTFRGGTAATAFYSFDPRGNTALRTDVDGAVLDAHSFSAYGQELTPNTSGDPYAGFGAQFGYYHDSATGLDLLGHRFYDPSQGRFVNQDPIGLEGGLNPYEYAWDDPVDNVDPSGLWTLTFGFGAAGMIGPIGGGFDGNFGFGDHGWGFSGDFYGGTGAGLGFSDGIGFGFTPDKQKMGSSSDIMGGYSGFGDLGLGVSGQYFQPIDKNGNTPDFGGFGGGIDFPKHEKMGKITDGGGVGIMQAIGKEGSIIWPYGSTSGTSGSAGGHQPCPDGGPWSGPPPASAYAPYRP